MIQSGIYIGCRFYVAMKPVSTIMIVVLVGQVYKAVQTAHPP